MKIKNLRLYEELLKNNHGKKTIRDIAEECQVKYQDVLAARQILKKKGVVISLPRQKLGSDIALLDLIKKYS